MRKQLTFWSLALGVALAAYLFARDASPAKVAATGAPAPVQVAVTPVVEPMPKTEPAAEPAPLPGVTFQAGFCSDGEAESFTTRATLSNLLQTLEPSDPAHTEVQAALEARTQNDFEGELAAVRRARRLLPRDPALGWAIARLTRESASLDEAIEGLTVFLAVQPVPSLSRLRARLEVARDIQQDYRREQRGGVTLLWPAAALDNGQVHDLALEVDRALDDAARLIGKPRRPRLTVVVYPSRSELLAVTCAAAWSAAVYDGTLRVVAGNDGVDLRTVRHETLHAQLTPSAPTAPKWFHEGVAQSFAKQSERTRTWSLMVKNHTWLPFTSLDGSFQVFDGNDAELAYAQSYAMVELMRELGGDDAIATALGAFAQGADTATALTRACRREVTGQELLQFLERRIAGRSP